MRVVQKSIAMASSVLLGALTACAQSGMNTPVSDPSVSVVTASSISARGIEDEIIYFVLPDRFENGDTTNDKAG